MSQREAAVKRSCRDISLQRGVTLIELLVVAATVILLLGVTIPIVRQIKVHNDDLINLNNLGASATDFTVWSLDNNGVAVNPGLPEHANGNRFYEEMAPGLDPIWQYRNLLVDWPSVLYFSGFKPSPHWQATSGPEGSQTWQDVRDAPESYRYALVGTRYRYPDPMWTDASIWTNPGSGPMSVEEYAAFYKRVRLDQVKTPSRKGLLVYEQSLDGDDSHVSVSFIDGHALRHARSIAALAAVHPLSSHENAGRVVYATLNGYEGVDF